MHRATARVWYTDDPDWCPAEAKGEVLSWGREKAWVRVCGGSCSSGTCSLSSQDISRCFSSYNY
jgi:hypothetical protein